MTIPWKSIGLSCLLVGSSFFPSGCVCETLTSHDLAVPEVYPLGSTVRAHYHTMQANGEAVDFIIHRHEFKGKTAELTPAGKDHVLEIAARMRSAPFPVVVERSFNNSDPEIDVYRRNLVSRILADAGNPRCRTAHLYLHCLWKSQKFVRARRRILSIHRWWI